jgi:chromosome segregation ATPase
MPEEVKDDCRCMETISRNAISLIKELTQEHEMLSESCDHLEKTKDELLAERSRLTEEIERLEKLCALRDQDNKDTQDLLYKAEAENERLHASCTELERKCASLNDDNERLRAIPEQLYKEMSERMLEERKIEIKFSVRQMQERLKSVAYQSNDWSHGEHPMVVEIEDIDQIAKEMLEGEKHEI